jgi:osmotically-inducible protein OsmY
MKRRSEFVRGVALGVALGYLFDPRLGRRRRAVARDRALGRMRHTARSLRRRRNHLISQARGRWQRFEHVRTTPKPQPDDATLAHKVESTIFRNPDVPKGQISVNAERGVVYLRGEVPAQSMLDDLVARTREIQGVLGVESLLHLPGQQAPMHK